MNGFEPLSHERAFELLPWLVNGTLAVAERTAVEEHARGCIVCRRELKEQQRLHASVRAAQATDVSADAGFVRLGRDLDAAAAGSRRSRYAAAAPFAIAAAAGISVLAVLLWFTPLPQPGSDTSYSTLATAHDGDAALLDIVFAEDATAAEIQQLLDDIDGEIVAGPSRVGRYSVRVRAEQPNDGAQLQSLLGVLAADSRVRFAGRSLAEVAP